MEEKRRMKRERENSFIPILSREGIPALKNKYIVYL